MIRNTLRFVIFCFCLVVSAQAQTISYPELASRLTNLQHLATLPLPGNRAGQASSYDRASTYNTNTGQYVNWSANGDGSGIIRTEGSQVVLAEMQGPGCIWRIWSATPAAGHVRIYVDDTNSPAVDLTFAGYFDHANAPFHFPALVHTTAANGWNNYVPIPYQNFCKITADASWGQYYYFTYETFPSNTIVPTFSRTLAAGDLAALTNANQFLQNCGTDPAGVRAGQVTVTNVVAATGGSTQLVAQISGPRAITALRAKLAVPIGDAGYNLLRELALQIHWDGETNASVWSPLGDFFGSAPGTNAYSSLPLGHTSNGWSYCYWYMPFASNSQVRLLNDGTNAASVTFEITHAPLTQPIEQLGRFHAKWHRDAFLPTEPGRSAIDWTMLRTTGTGRYIGVMLHVWNPRGSWWGEGDEKFFIDGEKFPSIFGTGSEDYFGYAWSSGTEFRHAFHNQPNNEGDSKGHLSVNRWHLGDSVPFQQSFDGSIEKYYLNSRPTLYAATAYWYLAPGGVDPYGPVPLSERIGYWTPIASYRVPGAIEGELMSLVGISAGAAPSQDMTGFPASQWSNDAQRWWTGGSPGSTLDLGFTVTNGGTYKLYARMTKANDYAIVQLSLDGQPVGAPIDLYNSSVVATPEIDLGEHLLSAGLHTLRAEITGKNANAIASYMVGLDYIRLEPPIALVDALNLGNVSNDVAAVFSAVVNPVNATNPANYAINNGVSILSARMGGTPQTVLLQTTGLPGVPCTLTASNIIDLATNLLPTTTLPIEQHLNTWLRLDEASGSTANDSSGNGRHGSYQAGAAPGYAGKVLRAAKLDGGGGHVRLANGMANFATNGLTIALWARPTTEGGVASWARFVDFGNGAANDNILLARNGSSTTLTFEVYDGSASGGKINSPTGTLVLDQWQHLAVTMDAGGNVVLYKNGVPVVSGQTTVPAIVTRTSNLLGLSNWSTDGRYAGRLDDVRVYDRGLHPAAVGALAGGGGASDTDITLPTLTAIATVATTATSNSPPGVIAVRRAGNTNGAVTAQYTLSGTAINGVNYTNLPLSVVIPAGATNANVYVTPIAQSFPELSRIATLTLNGGSAYLLDQPEAASVTIQNNSLAPHALAAYADNAIGVITSNSVEVWFATPVTLPSAINLANYALLNAPGVSITNATFGPRQLRVVLRLNKPLSTNARLTVSGVAASAGGTVSNQIPISLRLNPNNVIANIYHAPTTRSTCLTIVSDGVVNNTNNASNAGFDTWGGAGNAPLTQFAGLLYGAPVDLLSVKVDLGRQFGDGGNWQTQPLLYLLKRPVDTASSRPESDPANWEQVPAQFVSGGTFQAAADANPSPATPIAFDLSTLPQLERACYGWAVGGVRGNGTFGFVSVTELRGYGDALGAPSLDVVMSGDNIVVSWPFWAGDFELEATPTPEVPGSWSPVGGTPQLFGDYFSLTIPRTGDHMFYRLKR